MEELKLLQPAPVTITAMLSSEAETQQLPAAPFPPQAAPTLRERWPGLGGLTSVVSADGDKNVIKMKVQYNKHIWFHQQELHQGKCICVPDCHKD